MMTAKPNSAVASQPCPLGHITADIRLRFARNFKYAQPLYAMPCVDENIKNCKGGSIHA